MSTPHNTAERGEIAEKMLLPVDAETAQYIADKYLIDPILFNRVRGMLGFTGTYKGQRISVMGTGTGIPSACIYLYELSAFYGVKEMIHLNGCQGRQPQVRPGDAVFAQGSCTTSGFLRSFFSADEDFAPTADFSLLCAAEDAARERDFRAHIGLVFTRDLSYGDELPEDHLWSEYGILADEMESAGLYFTGAWQGVRTLNISLVEESLCTGEKLTVADEMERWDDLISLSLDLLAAK